MWDSQEAYRRVAVLCTLLVLLAACSGSDGPQGESDEASSTGNARAVGTAASPAAAYDPSADAPPVIVLTRGDEELTLTAWTYCWAPEDGDEAVCADGMPPEQPEVLLGDGPIDLHFPVDGFVFESRFWDSTYSTQRPGPQLRTVDGHWQLDPPEELPTIVEVFGFGGNNDVIISFLVES